MKPYDEIFLQHWEYPEITWCVDRIDDPENDEEDWYYLLATPERLAAERLFKLLKRLVEANDYQVPKNHYSFHAGAVLELEKAFDEARSIVKEIQELR